MKKNIRILTFLLALTLLISGMPLSASAESGTSAYKKITTDPVKAGKYYYKIKTDSDGYETDVILRSGSKYTGYRKVMTAGDDIFTNGKYMYRVVISNDRYYLARYNAAGKNRKLIRKLPKYSSDYWWELGTVKGKYCFLTLARFDSFKYYTYRLNTGNKKLKRVMTNCDLYSQVSGSYVLGQYYMDEAGITANRSDLYKISANGKLSRIKKLGNHAEGVFIGKYLYYVSFSNDYDGSSETEWPATAKVYRCSRNGKNHVLLKKITGMYNGGGLHAESFTAAGCDITMEPYYYHLDFATGEVTTTYDTSYDL